MWYLNGQLMVQASYDNGEKVSLKFWGSEGNLITDYLANSEDKLEVSKEIIKNWTDNYRVEKRSK